jgi:hypothetical protein
MIASRLATRTSTLLLLLPLLASACDGLDQDGDSPPPAASPAQAEAPREFASDQALLDWMADTAQRASLKSARVDRDATGRVIGVLLENAQDRDELVRLLGGSQGAFSIGGVLHKTDVLTRKAAAPTAKAAGGIEVASQALTSGYPTSGYACSGAFCTSNESHNTHYTIPFTGVGYHDVGGSTSQWSGGYSEYDYAPIREQYRCYNVQGGWCTREICNPGDWMVQGTRTTSTHCHHAGGTNFLSVGNTYFVGNGTPSLTELKTGSNVAAVELSKWAFGKFIFPCSIGGPVECELTGVCTTHYGSGTGGSSYMVTADGSYDCR